MYTHVYLQYICIYVKLFRIETMKKKREKENKKKKKNKEYKSIALQYDIKYIHVRKIK